MYGVNFSAPYLLFVGLYVALALVERQIAPNSRWQNYIRAGCIALYLLFIGLRGYIGTDWYSYRLIFDRVPTLFSGGWGDFWSANLLEPGFVCFVSASKTLWNNYHFFVFLNACADVAILHLFLKRYANGGYALGFLVFLVMGGLTLSDLLRNVRSIGFFLLSLPYLSARRAVPYFGLNGLGMCFHITSILYLPLYWLLHRRWPKWVFIAVFIAGNAIFLLRIEFVRPLIERLAEGLGGRFAHLQAQYLLNELFDERYRLSLGYIERIVTSLLVLGFYGKLLRERATNVLFVNAYVLYFASFFFLSEIREFAARFSLLFIFSYWALVPALYRTMQVRFNRGLFLTAICLYALLKTAGLTGNLLYRYDNLLGGIEPYDRRVEAFERYYLNR
jgi:hypothetical protein